MLPPRQLVIDMIQIYLRGGDAMSKIIDVQDLLARLASSPILPTFPVSTHTLAQRILILNRRHISALGFDTRSASCQLDDLETSLLH